MPSPPVVFHVIPTLLTGGAERVLESLLLAPRAEPYGQVVVNLTGEGALSAPDHAVEVCNLGMSSPIDLPRTTRPQVIQSWLHYADFISLLALEWSGLRAETKLYWGVRASNLDLAHYGYALRLTVRACAALSRRPDAVIANSFLGRDAHLQIGYRPRIFAVIPNGVDTTRYQRSPEARARIRAALQVAENEQVAIHVARVDPMKDHEAVIEVSRRRPDISFWLVGQGTEELALPANATGLGNRSDVPDLYAAADVALSTSAFGEGFPNAVAEAMACELPVIATNVGDAARIVGTCGYVIKPRDTPALIASMDALFRMSSMERSDLGERSRQRIKQRFSLERSIETFDRLYLQDDFPEEAGAHFPSAGPDSLYRVSEPRASQVLGIL
jgi:glycosyltransferase involved in cell wall biosynthesis